MAVPDRFHQILTIIFLELKHFTMKNLASGIPRILRIMASFLTQIGSITFTLPKILKFFSLLPNKLIISTQNQPKIMENLKQKGPKLRACYDTYFVANFAWGIVVGQ